MMKKKNTDPFEGSFFLLSGIAVCFKQTLYISEKIAPTLFSREIRDSINYSLSIGRSVGRSITPLLFRRFASGFRITAPAQSHATVAVMYTASPTAPALQITAPAQPPRLMVSCILYTGGVGKYRFSIFCL